MSATPDSTLANPEQRIADLERQLAEREAELAEAREQQTATTEVLRVINSSPGDLAPVFNAILAKAHSLCGADFGALKTYDGEFFRHAAARSPSASARYGELMGADFRPGVGSVWARLVSGERFVHDFDFAEVAARASQDRAPGHDLCFSGGGRRLDTNHRCNKFGLSCPCRSGSLCNEEARVAFE